ncbi:MAG: zinc metalloprotease HtpX [Candidatus Firestonebacteria bacterium]|nr:zinc metalloprotease HtpX [Candidatus Firestonebacteria bacterium]
MNNIKTFLFLSLLTSLLVIAGGALGGQNGMFFAFFFACIMNFVSYWFSDKIVLAMYKAREINEQDDTALFAIIKEVADKASLPMPKVYIINDHSPNAFATGRNPEHAAVAVTTGIMNLLTKEELKGVLGHEFAHIKNRDILIGTVAATIAGAISMLASIARWGLMFGGMGGRRDDDRNSSPIAAIAMMIIAPIAAMLIQMAVSRSREYEADKDGALFSGSPKYLADALSNLESGVSRYPMVEANPATAHMFIVNPLRGGNSILKLFSTHPPIEERIEKLRKMI